MRVRMADQTSSVSNDKAPGRVPTTSELRQVFRNHHHYYEGQQGEVALGQNRGEQAVRRQHAGREVFELLQNGLDRAESRVEVRLVEREGGDFVLVVANDGVPVRVDPDYDYQNPPEQSDQRRPDFNALCSLHTSNKSPDESVGNKGIGFRSVFSLSSRVRVWSRMRDQSRWWGLEMHAPMTCSRWEERLADSEAVRRGHEHVWEEPRPQVDIDEKRPSYHFPLPIWSDGEPGVVEQMEEISTAVVVPVPEQRLDSIEESVANLEAAHLAFVGLFEDRRDLTIRFRTSTRSFTKRVWFADEEAGHADGGRGRRLAHWHSGALAEEADRADLDVSEPGAAVHWPARDPAFGGQSEQDIAQSRRALVYGYLPTLVESAFGVDIHADFQLRMDRTGLRLEDEKVGSYNRALVDAAAELHLWALWSHLGLDPDHLDWEIVDPDEVRLEAPEDRRALRPDFWCFVDPDDADSTAARRVVDHLADLLFEGGNGRSSDYWQPWARMAEAFFGAREEWPRATYDAFWRASKHWVDHACWCNSGNKTWRKHAATMADALREREVPVAPVVGRSEVPDQRPVRAIPLPARGSTVEAGSGRRHRRALFLRTGGEDSALELPEALREAGRAVTAFNFPADLTERPPQPLGARRFRRWLVLRELRQLPNNLDDWQPSPLAGDAKEAAGLQRELLRLAAELYTLQTSSHTEPPADADGFGPGWRVKHHEHSDAARGAGRAVATLFLPTTEGHWEPARQLTVDRVDPERLGDRSSRRRGC
jgi:hypothetical protein